MRVTHLVRRLGPHLLVCAAYALLYTLVRHVSFSYWFLPAGLRLALLLLVPYRYWPALVVGEMVPLAYAGFDNMERFGGLWTALMLVPPIGLAMPIVKLCRDRLGLISSKRPFTFNMGPLVFCAFLMSLLWTVVEVGTEWSARVPPSYVHAHSDAMAGRYFLGNYLGILTLTPLIFVVYEALRAGPWRTLPMRMAKSQLTMESILIGLPSLALLTVWGVNAGGDASQIARVAMFLPVVWLALRQDWRGAAVGGAMASVGIVLTMPALYDPSTLQAQVFMSLAITPLLLLGARIATLYVGERHQQQEGRLALEMAQRSIYMSELRMRQTSYVLEEISSAMQFTYNRMMNRLRHFNPETDERDYFRQMASAQQQMYRLADSLYPIAWRDRGLPAALREGTIARTLDEAGICYHCEIHGRGLSQLSSSLHITLYRLACEAVVQMLGAGPSGRIVLSLRGGVTNDRQWVVLRVDGFAPQPGERADVIDVDNIAIRLGASGAGLSAIEDRARVYGGTVHARRLSQGSRISILLRAENDDA